MSEQQPEQTTPESETPESETPESETPESRGPEHKTPEQLVQQTRGGALVTLKRNGRPQISPVIHTFDPVSRLLRISSTADRAKIANLRRDPRASYYVTTPDQRAYAVAEGTVELTPVATEPDDATVEELVEVYRLMLREHPDWDEYRAAMVADRRLVIRLSVERLTGQVGW